MLSTHLQLQQNNKFQPDKKILDQEKQFARDFTNETILILDPNTSVSQPVRPNCICKICNYVLVNPFECSNCTAPYCSKCIYTYLKTNQNCPDCT